MRIYFFWLFLWIMTLPQTLGQGILSPEQYLGFPVGADRRLADWQQIVGYFEKLAEASPRVLLQELGRTTEDNPFILVVVSHPGSLARLEELRVVQEKLADPRRLDGPLEALIARGRSVVLVTCSIHSTEVASAQMSMEFAWELATAEDEESREILDNVIFLLVPSLNPDGINIVNHWYRDTRGTPAEGTSPPRLYHKYVGHDNNRDWYMFTQKETRIAVAQVHNRWHPQIVYDLHQMGSTGARIFVPPFIDPIDRNVDPILQAQIVDLGGYLFSALIAAGRQGVVTHAIYDAFTPARAYQHYHGGVRILSESASARLATPVTIAAGQLTSGRDYDAAQPAWNFPVLWEGGQWRVRDIITDQKIALKACLLHAARNRRQWLSNFHRVAANALRRKSPYAFVIPPHTQQSDPAALFDLLKVLDFGLVEIHRAGAPFTASTVCVSTPRGQAGRSEFPEGSNILLMEQPYSSFAKTMLEIQQYPELRQYPGGPLRRPYDVTAHTLGIQMGVEVYQANAPFEVELEKLAAVEVPSGRIEGSGDYWLFSHANNASAVLTNRLLKEGLALFWAPNGFRAEGEGFPVGTLMARQGESAQQLESALEGLPISVRRVKKWPELAWQRIRLPRIGLYQSYAASMDEGWTRWILEQHEFPYTSLHDAAIRGGEIDDYDAVVLADQSARGIQEGLGEPYPEPYRGGLGDPGVVELRKFAEAGGTLIFLGAATDLPLQEWGLGAKEITSELSDQEFYVPGSLLRGQVHNRHPIGYGMGEETALMFVRSRAFEVSRGISIIDFPSENLLLSGWTDGEEHLFGKSALAELPLGKGRVILIGFRTQFRAQTRGTYKFLFNSLYSATVEP